MINSKLQLGFFTVLTISVFYMSFLVFEPYLKTLFIAIILRIAFDPVHEKILHFVKGRKNLASAFTIVCIFVFIIAPIGIVGAFLFDDIRALYTRIATGTVDLSFIEQAVFPVQEFIRGFVPDFSLDPLLYARQGLSFVIGHIGSVFSGAVSFLFSFFIMLLALFYLFRDGSDFRSYVVFLSPLSDTYDENILRRLAESVASVLKGSLLVAIIQGVLTGVGFAIFGVPNAIVWGAVAAVAALVPNVGTTLVLLPAVIFLFWSGFTVPAFGLLIWGVTIVGLVDNLLSPHLMSKGLRVHPLLILLSVLGGFAFFGPIGFVAGPVLITLFITLLNMYPSVVSGRPL